jgi:hypothetical protein
MISTKNLISSILDVPVEWVFEYYLNLSESLNGQDIKILSVFNAKDKVPSMCVYHHNGTYRFKDFSSGFQGENVELVQCMFKLQHRWEAANKITCDYQDYVTSNQQRFVGGTISQDRYKVVDYEMRHWQTHDQKYWSRFHIGSKMLEFYNVVPLSYYVMEKIQVDGQVKSFKHANGYIYGYFKNDGTLYKIYKPMDKDRKFTKVQNYIQGSEQLTFDKKYLVVTSSLKDLMTFRKLQIKDVEVIAPDSENSMLAETTMSKLIRQYKKIFVIFDNDEPGIVAAQRYHTKYNIPYVVLPLEKDIADSVEVHGIEKTRDLLLTLLKQAL